ncbi:elongation factor TS-domain-containing protein [Zopfochytrium polystomum]|nr:elongation factor TS-domain-containing protein [Zopfochytrium polystomum]
MGSSFGASHVPLRLLAAATAAARTPFAFAVGACIRQALRSGDSFRVRKFSTPAAATPTTVALVARLRKETQCPMHEARKALALHNNNYDAALAHIIQQSSSISSAKLEKLDARVSGKDGLVGAWAAAADTSVAALIEVNCETDFVSRGDVFRDLVAELGETLLAGADRLSPQCAPSPVPVATDVDVAAWLATPTGDARATESVPPADLISRTVAKVGEGVRVRRALLLRAATASPSASLLGVYSHSTVSRELARGTGRTAAVAVLEALPNVPSDADKLEAARLLARRIAQQVAGFAPLAVGNEGAGGVDAAAEEEGRVLLRQPFLMGGGTVEEVLKRAGKSWGLN